jgi:hypothetical protein
MCVYWSSVQWHISLGRANFQIWLARPGQAEPRPLVYVGRSTLILPVNLQSIAAVAVDDLVGAIAERGHSHCWFMFPQVLWICPSSLPRPILY